MGRESYIRAPYVRTRRSLGRPAAAPARFVECRGGARRLDDRRWDFSPPPRDRATPARPRPLPPRVGRPRPPPALPPPHPPPTPPPLPPPRPRPPLSPR